MIPGGFILKARKALESDLMDKPPLWSKLWDWMLLRAEWRVGAKLPRGSFLTSIDEMREAMSWLVGYRRVTPTKDEIRSAYEGFAKATMATTTKTTRGLIVSITNYDIYQNIKNYEGHDEGRNESDAKPTVTPHDSKEVQEEKNKNKGTPPLSPQRDFDPEDPDLSDLADYVSEREPMSPAERQERMMSAGIDGNRGFRSFQAFEEFWNIYPLQIGKRAAFLAWQAIEGQCRDVTPQRILSAIKAQVSRGHHFDSLDGRPAIPSPKNWLEQGRWDDVVRGSPEDHAKNPTAGMTLRQKLEMARGSKDE